MTSIARVAFGFDVDIACVSDHPDGFEWCVNAPAIDRDGVVYMNSNDGLLYGSHQGGAVVEKIFLGASVGAAYTPFSIDGEERIHAENLGQLFVIAERGASLTMPIVGRRRCAMVRGRHGDARPDPPPVQ